MRKPIQVLVYPVQVTDGNLHYLLLHRIASRGDFWQGVTGGVEEDEEIIDAARREMIEETGLHPVTIERVDYTFSYPVADRWRHLYAEEVSEITEYVFIATVDGVQTPQLDPREHDLWQWSNCESALALLKWPGNIEGLKLCDQFLRNRSSLI